MHKPYKCLPQEALKLIACATMFIDHFGAAIVPLIPSPYMEEIYYTCRIIGRLAYPIYAFLIAQGVRHTRKPWQYLLRLGIGAVISEVPFDLLFVGRLTLEYQNVMLTLLLGASALMAWKKQKNPWFKAVTVAFFAGLAELCQTDYGAAGVLMICVFGLVEKFWLQCLGLFLCNLLIMDADVVFFGQLIPIQLFSLPSMLFIGLYSGGKLTRNRVLQWFFYLFYPVHILFLWVFQGFLW